MRALPLYHTGKLTQLINGEQKLLPHMHIRVASDQRAGQTDIPDLTGELTVICRGQFAMP